MQRRKRPDEASGSTRSAHRASSHPNSGSDLVDPKLALEDCGARISCAVGKPVRASTTTARGSLGVSEVLGSAEINACREDDDGAA